MPQASEALRAKFPDGDSEALKVLEVSYNESRGLISPKVKGYLPTQREEEAIDYLVYEWDYAYDNNPQQTNDKGEQNA